MKKEYVTPSIEVVVMEKTGILQASGTGVKKTNGLDDMSLYDGEDYPTEF